MDWEKGSPVGRFLEGLSAGVKPIEAAMYAGINEATAARWAATGSALAPDNDNEIPDLDEAEQQYVMFYRRSAEIQGRVAVRTVGVWQKAAAAGDWRAAKDFMKHAFPERWGDRKTQVITGAEGGPVRVESATVHAVLGDPEIVDLLGQIESKVASAGNGNGVRVESSEPIEDAEIVEDEG